ncbi:MAG TPA: hypothetical protein VEH84_00715 [Alphaproteobacteria bacterium]|nr:hypothetical protein [Alphaproteobacteria bacterium]
MPTAARSARARPVVAAPPPDPALAGEVAALRRSVAGQLRQMVEAGNVRVVLWLAKELGVTAAALEAGTEAEAVVPAAPAAPVPPSEAAPAAAAVIAAPRPAAGPVPGWDVGRFTGCRPALPAPGDVQAAIAGLLRPAMAQYRPPVPCVTEGAGAAVPSGAGTGLPKASVPT